MPTNKLKIASFNIESKFVGFFFFVLSPNAHNILKDASLISNLRTHLTMYNEEYCADTADTAATYFIVNRVICVVVARIEWAKKITMCIACENSLCAKMKKKRAVSPAKMIATFAQKREEYFRAHAIEYNAQNCL